jgi:hypothetical protein
MAINPDNITTIRVDQLPEDTLNLTNDFAHSNGTELKKATIQALVDLVSTAIGSSSGVGYLAISVTDGQQLPDVPTEAGFFLAGAGTYLNINGYPDVICTENLNAIMSLTDHWELAVEIPINPLTGTVQSVTGSAVDNTDPLNPIINTTGGGGAVDSVNGQTGVVSIGLQSVTDEGNVTTNPIIFEDSFLQTEVGCYVGFPYFKVLNFGDGFITYFDNSDNTTARGVKFQDKDGIVAYMDDITGGGYTVVSSNITASNDTNYTVVANATFTDPSPTEGKGYVVFVRNGTATIGGTGYGVGSLVFRVFHSGGWSNRVYLDQTQVGSATQTALDLKQDILSYTPYRYVDATQVFYSGAVIGLAETVVSQTTILGDTFNPTDFMRMFFKVTKPITISNVTMRIRVNSTNNPATATQIATLALTAGGSVYGLMNRNFNLFNTFLYGYSFSGNVSTDIVSAGVNGGSTTYDTTNDLYVFFTIQLGNAADSVTFQLANISN